MHDNEKTSSPQPVLTNKAKKNLTVLFWILAGMAMSHIERVSQFLADK